MSSAPPGSTEDLRKRSLPELREMLARQEKLLRNQKFIRSLPDGGKKISDFVERVRLAIAEQEQLRRTTRLDFDLKQTLAHEINLGMNKSWTPDQRREISSDSSLEVINKSYKIPSRNQGIESSMEGPVPIRYNEAGESEGATLSNWMYNSTKGFVALPSETNEQPYQLDFLNHARDVSESTDDIFLDSLQRITINDDENQAEDNIKMDHFCRFHSNIPKKPHYMEVLEMRAKNPVPPHNKFRTNMLPLESYDSPSHSPQRRESPISAEERRRRDKKHLDDITAARLPPLHHMPTLLLSMEDSLAIQKQQKQNYEEIQAKLAAQKLAERLNIKMQSYNPEGDMSIKYREVRDEDDYHSSED